TTAYANAGELERDLRQLVASLVEIGARRLAVADVIPVLRIVQTFGFHLAAVDIRQNSHFHDLAVGQLLESADMPDTNFANWDEQARRDFLDQELRSPRPFTLPDMAPGEEANAVLSNYRMLAQTIKQYGDAGLGSLIVSMTRKVSDLLTVFLL